MLFKINNLLVISVLCSGYLSADEIIIEIPDGKIKGRSETTVTNTTFFAFQGIPYAQPPLNELRFQAPRPVRPWEGVLDATYDKNWCFQVNIDRLEESEDCLFINVFTPQNLTIKSSLLPVMFFIYGGGFIGGAAETANYGPHHLMEYDVILVTFNYRVGPFGFFSTGDDVIPGNTGLKDQNFALQWVNKNIQYFGGDPEKVTLFGQSAGAASVTYHILSPKSKGLFRGAISESGTALSPLAYQRNQVEITYQTAGYINPIFNNGNMNSSQLLEYLISLPAKKIDEASYTMFLTDGRDIESRRGYFYAPVVEHDHEDAFISKLMYETLKAGDINKIPTIVGVSSEEFIFFEDDEEYLKNLTEFFDNDHKLLVPDDMNIHDEKIIDEVAEKIKSLYSPGESFSQNPLAIIRYHTDDCFMRSSIKYAELQSKFTNVFFYQFSYSGVLGGHTDQSVEGFSSVGHGEEISYIFSHNYGGLNTTDLSKYPASDVLVLRRFITMFTNFAKSLNPTPENDELLENILWPKVNPTYFPYLDIGSYSRVRLHPQNYTYSVWESIYDEYGKGPYDTY